MGVAISKLVEGESISIPELSHQVVAIDAYNMLYQFLTTIRMRDGSPLKSSKGKVTSHIVGMFSRLTSLMEHQINLVFVFDGETPKLKERERERRKDLKQTALRAHKKAEQSEDIVGMKKYAGRTAVLTKEMVAESQQLLSALGIPYITAPSEAEAQAARIVQNGDADYVGSQDMDSLLFGAPKMIRNLSIGGKRKRPGMNAYYTVEPTVITLDKELDRLELSQTQLIVLGMLVGTDFNPGGIKGLGPKKGLKLVKEHGDNLKKIFLEAQWDEHQDVSWEEVYSVIANMPVTDEYVLRWNNIDGEAVKKLLIEQFEFSEERVQSSLDKLVNAGKQKGLGDFF